MRRLTGRQIGTLLGIGAVALLGMTLTGSAAAAPFAAVASVSPQVQYLGDSAGATFTFTVHNVGTTSSIGAVQIGRPGKFWTVTACPLAPAGWSTQRSDTMCRFRSADGIADDIAPGQSSSAFRVTATVAPGAQDLSGVWAVKVSKSSNFDTPSKLLAAASEPPGLGITAYSFQVLDAVVDPAVSTTGAACPAPSKSAITASTGHTIVICGRNRTTGSLTPTAAQSSLGGTFPASHGAFSSGAVAPTATSVILGSWSDVTITSTAGPNKTVIAKIGSNSSHTSPLTTLTGYEALNNPPVAVDDPAEATSEDSPLSFDPRTNDSDPDSDPILITAKNTTGTLGSVTITGSGTGLTYNPNGQFEYLAAGGSANDTFTYTIADPFGATDTATVTITVNGIDDPPVAVGDAGTVLEDASATAVAVLSNDSDVDGGPKSIASVTQPANGDVVITGGGTGLTYAPDPNYCNDPPGTILDTFTYTLAPGGSTATVTMTVTCVDDAPVAVDDAATVALNASATAVAVLSNDSDVDGGPISIASVTQPTHGTVAITGGGTGLTYAPEAGYCNTGAVPGDDTFTYTLNGGSTATVSMTVTCDAPPVAVDDSSTVSEDSGAGAVAVLANDTDADGGPKSIASVTQPANGDVVITGGGTGLTYAPAGNYCNSPPGTTLDTFTYTLTPGGSTATVSMTVTCVDDAPVAVDDGATVLEDASATAVDVLTNDTDIDAGPKSVTSVTQPANGTVAITGGGTGLTYAPAANYCNSPPGTTPDTFTYTLTPGGDTATVSMTVTCVNDAPTAVTDSFQTYGNTNLFVGTTRPAGEAGKVLTGSVLTNDTDPDSAHASLVAEPVTSAPTTLGGTVTIESDGNFTFYPDDGDSAATDSFTYRVCDASPCTSSTDANATGTLSLPISSSQIWYVKNNAAAGGDGTSDAPFDTLGEAETASGTGDTTYVFDGDDTSTNLDTGYTMDSGEKLLGERVTLQIGTDVLYTGVPANRPTLTANNEDIVALASATTVRGLQLDPQGTGGGISGTGYSGLGQTHTIDDVRIIDTGTAGTQPSLELDGVDGTYNVSDLVVDNSAATGQTSGSIGVRLNDSSLAFTANFASAGTISITTKGARGLEATGVNLGLASVFDDITVTGSATGGVFLQNTLGSGTSFVNLSLTTTGGTAFNLQGTGSVLVPSGGTANVNASSGAGILVNGSPGSTLSFDDVTVTSNPSGGGITLVGLGTGTFSAASGSITGTNGTAFTAGVGSGTITYPGTINNGVGDAVTVTGRTGGTVTLSGNIDDTNDSGGGITVDANTGGTTVLSGTTKTLNTGTFRAVQFSNSDGHTLTISGGGLDVDTTSGNGVEATSSGTLNITGAGNTIDTTAGKGLSVSDTDVGASPLAFQRISSIGGAGIFLSHTGLNPALTVASSGSGTCTAADQSGCTGGVIQNSGGADSTSTTPLGTGIVLNDTRGISLARMNVHDHSNYGIRGTSVVGFTMADSVIGGVNGTSDLTAYKDGSIRFEELTGTVSMTNVAISGGYFTNLMVDDTAGTLSGTFDNVDSLALNTGLPLNDPMATGGGDDAVQFEGIGTSTMNVDYKNSAITTAGGDLFQYIGDGTGGGNLDFTGNTLSNNDPSIATGGGGVALVAGAKGPATMDVLNNTMRESLTNALTIIKSADVAAGTNNLIANVTGNSIGLAGTANSGSREGDGMEMTTFGDGNATFNVTNNNVFQYNSSGMQFVAGSGVAGTGQFNLNISGNTVANPGTNPLITLLQGIRVDSGVDAADTFSTCVKFGANSITGSSDASNKDFRLVASQSTTIRQPGYVGGNTDGAAFAAYAAGLIGSGAVGTAVANAPATFSGTGTTCP